MEENNSINSTPSTDESSDEKESEYLEIKIDTKNGTAHSNLSNENEKNQLVDLNENIEDSILICPWSVRDELIKNLNLFEGFLISKSKPSSEEIDEIIKDNNKLINILVNLMPYDIVFNQKKNVQNSKIQSTEKQKVVFPSLQLDWLLRLKLINNLNKNHYAITKGGQLDIVNKKKLIDENKKMINSMVGLSAFETSTPYDEFFDKPIEKNELNVMINQLKDELIKNNMNSEVSYLFEIKNINEFQQEIKSRNSDQFYLLGIPFFVNFGSKIEEGSRYYAIYIHCDYNPKVKWLFKTKVTFRLLTHLTDEAHLKKEFEYQFCMKTRRGYPEFIYDKDLIDPANGYIKDNTIFIQVNVLAIEKPIGV